jgi:uncharacterized membrane protein
MQITRHNHVRYMTKLTPFLIALYILQVILYQKFAPSEMAGDMNFVLGIGLALIILCYQFYDFHHKITLRENYIEVTFDVLKMKDEILYSNVVHVEIIKKRHYYAHMVLHLRDGSTCHFHHVDSPEIISDYIEKKKIRRS